MVSLVDDLSNKEPQPMDSLHSHCLCIEGGVTVGACSCGVPGCEAVDHLVKLGTTRSQLVMK